MIDKNGEVVIVDAGGASPKYIIHKIEKIFVAIGEPIRPIYFYRERAKHEMDYWIEDITSALILGENANRDLVGRAKLTRQRGSWNRWIHSSDVAYERPTLSSMSPAWFRMTNENKYPLLYWDFSKWCGGQQEIVEDFFNSPVGDTLRECVERLKKQETISVDTEWYAPYSPAYIGFGDGDTFSFTLFINAKNAKLIHELLALPQPKVFQNAMFDCVTMDLEGFHTKGEILDTMVAFGSVYPDLGEKSLATLNSIYNPRSYYKSDVEFVGKDDELGQTYCNTDVVVTGNAFPQILEDLTHTRTNRGYEISMSIFETMRRATVLGFRVNMERYNHVREHYARTADLIEGSLHDSIGVPINCRSPQQVQALVFDFMGIKGRKRTSEQTVLMDIAADPKYDLEVRTILTAIVRVRQNRKLVSSYFHDGIFGRDGRVRTNWNLAGTRGGRLSSTKMWGEGLAMQTVPKAARDIFIPDVGCVFVGFDLAQAEARVVAVLTRDFALLEDMERGVDIHCRLGSQIPSFGLTYEEMMEMKKELGGDFIQRFLSKTLRHSINYVATWHSLKATINKKYLDTGIGISAKQAKMYRGNIMDINPGLEEWWDRTKNTMNTGQGRLENPFGRARNFDTVGTITDHLHREGVSFVPQSAIADLTTMILRGIDERTDFGRRGQVMAHFHDGGMIQCKEEDAEWMCKEVEEAAQITFSVEGVDLLIPCEVKVGMSWGEL